MAGRSSASVKPLPVSVMVSAVASRLAAVMSEASCVASDAVPRSAAVAGEASSNTEPQARQTAPRAATARLREAGDVVGVLGSDLGVSDGVVQPALSLFAHEEVSQPRRKGGGGRPDPGSWVSGR
jgi:hypothetical protein